MDESRWGAAVVGALPWVSRAAEASRPEAEPADIESLLRAQNVANDELCSENARIRAEVERLRAEAQVQAQELPPESEPESEELADPELELLGELLEALQGTGLDAEQLEPAVRSALSEYVHSQPADTVAVLVSEKVALRELVETQGDRISFLERELDMAGEEGLLAGGLSAITRGAKNLDAGRRALSGMLATKKPAVVNCEYEVVGRRGIVVREGEPVTSDQVGELAPGALVRVVALSDTDPRRVEIISVCAGEGEHTAACVGWVSATTSKGDPLIRPVAPVCDSTEPEGKEEGGEDVACVTLTSEQWQLLHQDKEAAMEKLRALSSRLNDMSRELLQSFEMRTVLGELELALERARRDHSRLEETAAMAREELISRKAAMQKDLKEPKVEEPEDQLQVDAIDWERLRSERETTSTALSAAHQRLLVLERESAELDQEGKVEDDDLGTLKATLRTLTQPVEAPESPPDDALFERRVQDLLAQVADLQEKVGRASASEVTLRRSVQARKAALRRMLLRWATSGIVSTQCGPFNLLRGHDAEREALHQAVEEQLKFNLDLNQQ